MSAFVVLIPDVQPLSFCKFVTASPTPFHVVANLSHRLLSKGFKQISERRPDLNNLKAGGKFFYTRNQSSIVAFTLPLKSTPETAISFAVGHSDSPCLKVRPVSKRVKEGYMQVGVELYGGGIWTSWFDRDLSLAGRVIISSGLHQKGGEAEDGSGYISKLVKIDRPLLRIPTLAIHLDRSINEAFKFNKETEFRPIIGLISNALNAKSDDNDKISGSEARKGVDVSDQGGNGEGIAKMEEKHHSMMLTVLAEELGCSIQDIQDFEL